MSRVFVCGSRGFKDYTAMVEAFQRHAYDADEIVTGDEDGADAVCREICRLIDVPCEVLPTQYQRGHVPLPQVDSVLAFWDGMSPGTKAIIAVAKKAGKPVAVVYYK